MADKFWVGKWCCIITYMYAICQQDVDMMLRAKVVVGLSYKLKSHIPKWGNEPHVVMERGGKVRGKSLNFH